MDHEAAFDDPLVEGSGMNPSNSPDTHQRTDIAWITTVFAGIMAALHIWKLPAAIPVLQDELHISLILSGVLLGVVQVAGMVGGLAMSLLAEIFSQRKIMLLGLLTKN